MNLAEATAALSEKDSEKTAVLEEIKILEKLRDSEIIGTLNFMILSLNNIPDHISNFFFNFVIDDTSNEHDSEITKIGLNQSVQLQITSKSSKVNITCPIVLEEKSYIVDPETDQNIDKCQDIETKIILQFCLNIMEVSEDMEVRMELEDLAGNTFDNITKKPIIIIKASCDRIDAALRSKQLEFEQVSNEFRLIGNQVKDLRNNTSEVEKSSVSKVGKEKDKKKKKKSSSNSINSDHSVNQSSFSNQGLVDIATGSVVLAASVLVEYRPFILFGLSAIGIFFVGDYASV